MSTAFCPHCNCPMPAQPVVPIRCDACRLIVGAGRAMEAIPPGRAGSIGGASGRLAHAAARADASPGDPEEIFAALRQVAEETAMELARVRLFDYEPRSQERPDELPSPATVLATFGSWKAARAAAVEDRDRSTTRS